MSTADMTVRLAAVLGILLCLLLTVVNPLEGDVREADNVLQQDQGPVDTPVTPQEDTRQFDQDSPDQQQADSTAENADIWDAAADVALEEQRATTEQFQDQDIPYQEAGDLDQGSDGSRLTEEHQRQDEQYQQGENQWQEDWDQQQQQQQAEDLTQEGKLDDRDATQGQQEEQYVQQQEEPYQPPLTDDYQQEAAEQTGTEEQVQDLPDTDDNVVDDTFVDSDSRAPPVGKPNILILYADDLGIGDIGCYGNTSLRTPNLDRMAAQGARMTHHLSAAASGTPSRAGFLTGRLPIRYGMAPKTTNDELTFLSSMTGLPSQETTFAEVLQQNGYMTGLVGKWGLGLNCERSGDLCHHPNNQGFDHFFGAPIGNLRGLAPNGGQMYFDLYPEVRAVIIITPLVVILAAFFLRKYLGSTAVAVLTVSVLGYAAWCYVFYTQPQLWSSALMRNGEFVEQPINFERMTERLVKEGNRFLIKARQEDGRPFLLMMSWLQVHSFLHATPRSEGSSSHGPYGDEVEELDWAVGEMLRTLKLLGFERNTLVYFTSDNGAHTEEVDHLSRRIGGHNGKFRGGKYQGGQDGGIRTPGLVLWPGVVPAGMEIQDPTSQLDVAPTLADLAGAAVPSDRLHDGRSILRLWQGKTKASPHRVLFHYCAGFLHTVRFLPDSGTDVYTVHFYWPKWLPGSDRCGRPACSCLHDHERLDTPVIYNIVADPGLTTPLDSSGFEYEDILNYVQNAIREHQAGVVETENEFSWYKRSWHVTMQPCCNFPSCSCSDPDNALQDPELA